MKDFFRKRLRPFNIIFAILAAAIMVTIFVLSCENADESSDTSGGITGFVVSHFVSGFEDMTAAQQQELYSKADHIVRKCAHFSAYAALGFCLSMAYGSRRLLSPGSAGVVGVCFLYACSDEIHQTFVPGRAGMFTDVLIDTSGAFTGMLFSMLIMLIVFRKQRQRIS